MSRIDESVIVADGALYLDPFEGPPHVVTCMIDIEEFDRVGDLVGPECYFVRVASTLESIVSEFIGDSTNGYNEVWDDDGSVEALARALDDAAAKIRAAVSPPDSRGRTLFANGLRADGTAIKPAAE